VGGAWLPLATVWRRQTGSGRPPGNWRAERHVTPRSRAGWQYAVKRLLDVAVAGVGLVLVAPLVPVIAVAIKASSPGPVFYRWPVVGQHGRPLKAYKFRTMVVGADELKPRLAHRNEASGPVFKMRDDPRVTPVGRVLRKFGLDEIPQLWSVLKGDMSLVGPRPVLTYEWEQFEPWQRRKLSVKPGIICLWHIRGQPRDFDRWLALDLEYIDTWSLSLDLKVLIAAPLYILAGRNY
jgi:lipopolysaccharide/colanic/teichoic acid biosynthesis glycosyltransferase